MHLYLELTTILVFKTVTYTGVYKNHYFYWTYLEIYITSSNQYAIRIHPWNARCADYEFEGSTWIVMVRILLKVGFAVYLANSRYKSAEVRFP
jgi:hypothetical protein